MVIDFVVIDFAAIDFAASGGPQLHTGPNRIGIQVGLALVEELQSEPIRKRTRSALYALAAETHCQASILLTKWSLWHQAMADDNFGGMTPKGNVAWVPTALSALATMELA